MEKIFLNGLECHINGNLPKVGENAPNFDLVSTNLQPISNKDFAGKNIILNIFPSLDTDVCAMSVRRFNKDAGSIPNTVILCVSMDLPFAAKRFCSTNGIDNVFPASAFRSTEFSNSYGVKIIDGPLSGLLARAVIVIDKNMKILRTMLVDEITHEPNYEEILKLF